MRPSIFSREHNHFSKPSFQEAPNDGPDCDKTFHRDCDWTRLAHADESKVRGSSRRAAGQGVSICAIARVHEQALRDMDGNVSKVMEAKRCVLECTEMHLRLHLCNSTTSRRSRPKFPRVTKLLRGIPSTRSRLCGNMAFDFVERCFIESSDSLSLLE